MVIREVESTLGSSGYVFSMISVNQVGVVAGDCSTMLTLDAKTTIEFIGVVDCSSIIR